MGKQGEEAGAPAWPSGEEQVPEDTGRGSPLYKAGESEFWGCPREMKVDLPRALVCAGAGERRIVHMCVWVSALGLRQDDEGQRGRGAKQALRGRNFSLDRAPPFPDPV